MDLGNAALFIKHAKDNSTYTFGLSFGMTLLHGIFLALYLGNKEKRI